MASKPNKRTSLSPQDMGHRNTNGKKDPRTGSPMPQNYEGQVPGTGFGTITSSSVPYDMGGNREPAARRSLENPGPNKPIDPGSKGPDNPANKYPSSGLATGAFDTAVHTGADSYNPNPLPKPKPITGEWPGGKVPKQGSGKGKTTGGGN